jgi:hypothetical protein
MLTNDIRFDFSSAIGGRSTRKRYDDCVSSQHNKDKDERIEREGDTTTASVAV